MQEPVTPEGRRGSPEPEPRAGLVTVVVNWIGAICSVSLVIGLILWSWRVVTADSREVPVIRALAEAHRIAPLDPGGELDVPKGLAVNRVQAEGTAAPPPEKVVLAPPPPAPTEEDVPMAALARPTPTAAPAAQAPEGVAAIRPVAPLVIDGVEDTRAPAGPAGAPAAGEPAPAAGFVSPVPPPRPLPDRRIADDVARALAAVTDDGGMPASGGIDIAPEAVAPGTPTAQLGAFDSREAALKAWDEVARRNPAVLAGKKRLLIAAERAGKRFWRLRAVGFADRAEARNFCSVLVARGELCVSVLTR